MASKSSKPLPPLGPGRRAQPMRSSKANAPWPNEAAELARSDTYAITFFADAITALPRELVRHFTLLKEVDAKIFLPEAALEKEVQEALDAPLPKPSQDILPPTRSGHASLNGSMINGHGSSIASPADAANQINPVLNEDNLPRRQKFRSLSLRLSDMLLSLDEKNHVISTAVEALNKQMARLDDCYPAINNEISEEARYGNVKHWAYEENRTGRTVTEKARREVAEPTLTAAQQAQAEEIAARSETRKLAVQAKRGRNNHNESDFDDHNDGRKLEPTKKLHGNSKVRKAAEATTAVGLGISNGTPVNGNPPSKRRKVEKPNNNALGGSLASALANNGVAKGKAGSPRDTPIPETKRKAKAAPTTNGSHSRKRNNTATSVAQSPSLQSSPVHSTFAEAKLTRASPAPANGRPASSRARQNSTHSLIDGTRQRPGSSASIRVNGNSKATVESNNALEPDQTVLSSKTSVKDLEMTEPNVEEPKEDIAVADAIETKKDDLPAEDLETRINGDSMQDVVMTSMTTAPPVVTTRNGRASKPSTPAIPSFPETMAGNRSGRSSRNQHENPNNSAANSTTSSGSGKRSHKKGAGAAAAAAAAAMQQQAEKEKDLERSGQEPEVPTENAEQDIPMEDAREEDKVIVDNDETLEGDTTEIAVDEVDEDEPRYCYCDGVSYGEMVGCDAEGCVREWFHLGCVGLKVAPKGNAKWYCDDCKEKVKNSKRGRSSG